MRGKSLFVGTRKRQACHRRSLGSERGQSHGRASHIPGTGEIPGLRRPARSGLLPQPLPEKSRGSPGRPCRGVNPRACGAGIRRQRSPRDRTGDELSTINHQPSTSANCMPGAAETRGPSGPRGWTSPLRRSRASSSGREEQGSAALSPEDCGMVARVAGLVDRFDHLRPGDGGRGCLPPER